MSPLHTPLVTFRTVVGYGLGFLVLLILGAYITWQARFLLLGPQVQFANTLDTVQTDRTVTLTGTASNIIRITINGREIFTTPDGYFQEEIVLENGYTVTTVAAYDRYGRTRTYEYEFVHKSDSDTQG